MSSRFCLLVHLPHLPCGGTPALNEWKHPPSDPPVPRRPSADGEKSHKGGHEDLAVHGHQPRRGGLHTPRPSSLLCSAPQARFHTVSTGLTSPAPPPSQVILWGRFPGLPLPVAETPRHPARIYDSGCFWTHLLCLLVFSCLNRWRTCPFFLALSVPGSHHLSPVCGPQPLGLSMDFNILYHLSNMFWTLSC